MTYKPTPIDINWLEDMVNMLNNGGMLAFKRSGLVYRIDKEAKTFTLMNPEVINPWDMGSISCRDHAAQKETAKVIGYRVR